MYDGADLRTAYSRVHNALAEYYLQSSEQVKVFFAQRGHTPIIKGKNHQQDIRVVPRNDGGDVLREKWLSHFYGNASADGWTAISQPVLTTTGAPVLDRGGWKKWGKHAPFLLL